CSLPSGGASRSWISASGFCVSTSATSTGGPFGPCPNGSSMCVLPSTVTVRTSPWRPCRCVVCSTLPADRPPKCAESCETRRSGCRHRHVNGSPGRQLEISAPHPGIDESQIAHLAWGKEVSTVHQNRGAHKPAKAMEV